MEDLYLTLLRQGYSKEQVEEIFRVLYHFIDSRYPIIAKLAEREIFQFVDPAVKKAA